MTITLTIPGKPFGKPRTKSTRYGRHYRVESDLEYEALVIRQWLEAGSPRFDDGPLILYVTAVYQIPQSFSKKKRDAALAGELLPTVKPDFDNILKAVTDPLNGRLFRDDACIVGVSFRKIYGEEPCVEVTYGIP